MASILNCGQKMTFSSYHISPMFDFEDNKDADYAGVCMLNSEYEAASCMLIIKWYEGKGFLVLFRVYDDHNIYCNQTPYEGLVPIELIKADILPRFKDGVTEDGRSIGETIYEELANKTIRKATEG
jgi:hypothetical protein